MLSRMFARTCSSRSQASSECLYRFSKRVCVCLHICVCVPVHLQLTLTGEQRMSCLRDGIVKAMADTGSSGKRANAMDGMEFLALFRELQRLGCRFPADFASTRSAGHEADASPAFASGDTS